MGLEAKMQRDYSQLEWTPFIGPVITIYRIFREKGNLADSCDENKRLRRIYDPYIIAQILSPFLAVLTEGFTRNPF